MTYYFDPEPEGPEPEDPRAAAQESGPRPWFVRFVDAADIEPIDRYGEILAARDHRWAGRAIFLAALLLAVFNAAAITSWASSLPPNWGTETVRAVAGVWSDRLSDLGLDQPRTAIRNTYEAQKAKRWG